MASTVSSPIPTNPELDISPLPHESLSPYTFTLYLEPDSELQPLDPVFIESKNVRQCKITTALAHAQFGRYASESACFLKYQFTFMPHDDIRFKAVTIRLTFTNPKPAAPNKQPSNGSPTSPPPPHRRAVLRIRKDQATQPPKPVVLAYEPKFWQGDCATTLSSTTFSAIVQAGLALSYQAQPTPGASYGPKVNTSLGVNRESSIIHEGRTSVISTRESESILVWQLTENSVNPQGVPNPFEVVMIVKDNITSTEDVENALEVGINFKVKLTRSVNPSSWVNARAVRNEKTVLTASRPVGEPVEGIMSMEQDSFLLTSFIKTDWKL